jgi:anti-anti-sigma factor
MADPMVISIDDGDDVVTATVGGEVDISNAGELQEKLADAVESQPKGFVIDLSKTTYLDSSGIQVLFGIGDQLQKRGQALHLVVVPGSFLADVADVVNLSAAATIHPELGAAVEAGKAG